MSKKVIIFQLTEDDAEEVIVLIELEALTRNLPSRYSRILKIIREQVEQQANGQFFQCAACFEENQKSH
jgi:transcription initiation factor IIE alpha subunit